MEKKVLDFIEQYHIFQGVSRVVIGVSGGADSVALAHFVVGHFPDMECIIAHVHHGLRAEADEEETFVRDFAAALGADFRSCRRDISRLAKEGKRGIEETGREERYRFFRSLGADLILTAHHKDDQAETVLLHLSRGCGVNGLRGMEPRTADLGRPFLCVTKDEILAYCVKNGLSYKNDMSNEDTVYTRNRIRKEWLPLMEELNPNITESLWRLSRNASSDDDLLNRIAADAYEKACYERDGHLCLRNTGSVWEEPAIARRMIRMAAEKYGVGVDFEHTEGILALTNGKMLPLSEELWVCCFADHFSFGPRPVAVSPAEETVIPSEGDVSVGKRTFTSLVSAEAVKGDVSSRGVFDVGLFETAPVVRTRRNGDYVLLPNGKRKKLSDYFIDEKIPSSQRDEILLLAVEQRVLWVIGHRFFAPKGQKNLIVNISVKS